MVLAKSKQSVGLGNSLMNDRFGRGKGADRKKSSAMGVLRTGVGGETYVTNAPKEASWVKMRSITEQAALDEFLSTAELAGTDFTAEKLNSVKIIHSDQRNPYLLSTTEERNLRKRQRENFGKLTVPRRPKWDASTTAEQLDRLEREALLEWRRGLAEVTERQDLLMTPFERNLEVWRQLWRVIERSDLVVQIVDARNPLLFRCEDLERYVGEVGEGMGAKKGNLLLVNKADMMTEAQRQTWADWFDKNGVSYRFFSARLAKESLELDEIDEIEEDRTENAEEHGDTIAEDDVDEIIDIPEKEDSRHEVVKEDEEDYETEDEDEEESEIEDKQRGTIQPTTASRDSRTEILTVDELEALFLSSAPSVPSIGADGQPRKIQIGLVGYPNVGKSSTINALIGAKKVSVSSTPGKTKHFQTIHLSDKVMLCDCPGLVFPNFASTKAELVCNGILPIDQLREFIGPAGLVAQRIPRRYFERVYGVKIRMRPLDEGGTGVVTAMEMLSAYAVARGFANQNQGGPDVSRAARFILKDYVNGKLLFCHPPPAEPAINAAEFNAGLYEEAETQSSKRRVMGRGAMVQHLQAEQDEEDFSQGSSSHMNGNGAATDDIAPGQGRKGKALDKKFFSEQISQGKGHLSVPLHIQQKQQQGMMSIRKNRQLIAGMKGVSVKDVIKDEAGVPGKKHFKGRKAGSKSAGSKAAADDEFDL